MFRLLQESSARAVVRVNCPTTTGARAGGTHREGTMPRWLIRTGAALCGARSGGASPVEFTDTCRAATASCLSKNSRFGGARAQGVPAERRKGTVRPVPVPGTGGGRGR
jgi:hypothetical protein